MIGKKKNLKFGVYMLAVVLICLIGLGSAFYLVMVCVSPQVTGTVPVQLTPPLGTKQYIVNTTTDLEALSDQWNYDQDVIVDPTADISGTLSNFTHMGSHDFRVESSVTYSIDITLVNVSISRDVEIKGTATVTLTDCWIAENLIFWNSPTVTMNNVDAPGPKVGTATFVTIGSPAITIDGLWATSIHFEVSGGSFALANGNVSTTGVTLLGFDTVTMTDVNITDDYNLTQNGNVALTGVNVTGRTTISAGSGPVSFSDSQLNELHVYSTAITTIENTPIGTLVDPIDPTLVVTPTYNVEYSFLFQPSVEVTITWTGYDNIQGTGYGASFNLTIYKDGDPLPIISQTSTSYTLDMQTASSYIIRIIAEDTQGNVGSEEVITVTPVPKMLPFLMLIIGIAGGAIGAVLFLYWRKQRQWQKTTLMEIPT